MNVGKREYEYKKCEYEQKKCEYKLNNFAPNKQPYTESKTNANIYQ